MTTVYLIELLTKRGKPGNPRDFTWVIHTDEEEANRRAEAIERRGTRCRVAKARVED